MNPLERTNTSANRKDALRHGSRNAASQVRSIGRCRSGRFAGNHTVGDLPENNDEDKYESYGPARIFFYKLKKLIPHFSLRVTLWALRRRGRRLFRTKTYLRCDVRSMCVLVLFGSVAQPSQVKQIAEKTEKTNAKCQKYAEKDIHHIASGVAGSS
jgi:hypothetical protein